jgi:hypothetical protein
MNLASVLAPSAVAYIDKQLRRKYQNLKVLRDQLVDVLGDELTVPVGPQTLASR